MLNWLWSKLNKQKVFIGERYIHKSLSLDITVVGVDNDDIFLVDGRKVFYKFVDGSKYNTTEKYIIDEYILIPKGVS